MSVQGTIKINTTGLVFHYDTYNSKSYVGEPTTNLLSNASTLSGWTSYSNGNDGTFTTEFGTTGIRMVNRTSWNGAYIGVNLGSTGTHTFSAYIRYWGGTSANNGGRVYVSGFGLGGDTDIGADKTKVGVWQRVSLTINATAASGTLYLISYGGSGSDYSTWDFTMPQIEKKSHSTPFTTSTRSVTQGLVDLTGTTSIDLTNGGYDSVAAPLFTGSSSNYWTLQSGFLSSRTSATVSSWFYWTGSESWSRVFDFGTGQTYNMFLTPKADSGTMRFAITTSGGAGEQRLTMGSALSQNTWYNVAVTMSGSAGIIYLNGASVVTNNSMTLTPSSLGSTNLNYIGKSQYSDPYFNGKIPMMSIYSRALSSTEVLSNYNATRSRFGL